MIDHIVIGGGVAGLSAAAALAPHGETLLFEAEDSLGHHASGRSAAVFLENYGNAVVRALNTASLPHHQDAGILRGRDFLLVARPEEAKAFATEKAAFAATQVTIEEAQALFPILNPASVGHAAHLDTIFDMDTDRLLQGYARSARKHGAEIVTKAPVQTVTRIQGGWHVTTPTRAVSARHIVNAAGAWADEVAGLAGVSKLGLTPMRRSMARLAPPGGQDTRDWAMVDAVGESWYAKPDAGALLVSPSEEDPTTPHDAWAEDLTLAEGLARYEAFMTEPVTRPLATWAGLRTFAPDRALVIGQDPQAPGFWWLAGQGGYGFQTAPAAARLLCAQMTGSEPELPGDVVAALAPDRFR